MQHVSPKITAPALVGLALAGALGWPSGDARAHLGNPTVAWLNDPVGVGTVVDEEVTFTWVDFDMSIPTGTATVDFFYTDRRPPAYLNGEIHPLLEGTPIVQGIWEKDPDNSYTWDTSDVPAGSYFIWSVVLEPPEAILSPQIVSFSPGVLTIAHPGDEVHPALLVTTPSSPFQFADEEHVVRWQAFDPDGTGLVTIEVGTSSLGEDFETIAADLPASDESFLWITEDVPEDEWQVRATITDARGLSFTTYSQYVLQVTHVPSEVDAGVVDAGSATADAGVRGVPDAGFVEVPGGDGCRCVQPQDAAPSLLLAVGLGLLGLFASRRRLRSQLAPSRRAKTRGRR